MEKHITDAPANLVVVWDPLSPMGHVVIEITGRSRGSVPLSPSELRGRRDLKVVRHVRAGDHVEAAREPAVA